MAMADEEKGSKKDFSLGQWGLRRGGLDFMSKEHKFRKDSSLDFPVQLRIGPQSTSETDGIFVAAAN